MLFSEDRPGQGYAITAYDDSGVSVNGVRYTASLVLAPDNLRTEWAPAKVSELQREHFQAIIELQPELVLLGTGAQQRFPEVRTYASIVQLGIGLDVMDTGALCRTYNILVSEGRRVVAGIILPG